MRDAGNGKIAKRCSPLSVIWMSFDERFHAEKEIPHDCKEEEWFKRLKIKVDSLHSHFLVF